LGDDAPFIGLFYAAIEGMLVFIPCLPL